MLIVRRRKSSSTRRTISVVVWCEIQFRFGVNKLREKDIESEFLCNVKVNDVLNTFTQRTNIINYQIVTEYIQVIPADNRITVQTLEITSESVGVK